jgi:hypothetical protein
MPKGYLGFNLLKLKLICAFVVFAGSVFFTVCIGMGRKTFLAGVIETLHSTMSLWQGCSVWSEIFFKTGGGCVAENNIQRPDQRAGGDTGDSGV